MILSCRLIRLPKSREGKMRWSDIARQNASRARLAQQQHQAAAQSARNAAAAQRDFESQVEERVEQFLLAMKEAGNPGIKYLRVRDAVRGVGYWGTGAFAKGRQAGREGVIVRTDGTWQYAASRHPEDDWMGPLTTDPLGFIMQELASIMAQHHVPLPRD